MSKGVLILVLVSVVWSIVSAILQKSQEKRSAAAGPDAGEAPDTGLEFDRASALRRRRPSTTASPPAPPAPLQPLASERPISEHTWKHLSGTSHPAPEPVTPSNRFRQKADVRALLRSPHSLRSAIIVSEILGRPKGV